MLAFLDEAIAEVEDPRPRATSCASGSRPGWRAGGAEAMARRGVVDGSGQAWRDPRRGDGREIARGPERAAGARCTSSSPALLLFVASVPNALREARGARGRRPGERGGRRRISSARSRWRRWSPTGSRRWCIWRRGPSAARGSFLAARTALFSSALAGGAGGARRGRCVGVAARRRCRRWRRLVGGAARSRRSASGSGSSPRAWPRPRASPPPVGSRRWWWRPFAGIGGLLALAAARRWSAQGREPDAMWGELILDTLPASARRRRGRCSRWRCREARLVEAAVLVTCVGMVLGYAALWHEPGRDRRSRRRCSSTRCSARWRSSRSWR